MLLMRRIYGQARSEDSGGAADCGVEASFDYRVTLAEAEPPVLAGVIGARPDGVTDGADGAGVEGARTGPKSYVIAGRSVAMTLGDGSFAMDLPAGLESDPVRFMVSSPSGEVIGTLDVELGALDQPVNITVQLIERIEVDSLDEPPAGAPTKVVGRVFDVSGAKIPSGLQVVVHATVQEGTEAKDARAVLVTRTDAGGYFTGDRPLPALQLAFALVDGIEAPIEISLDEHRLPSPLLLPVDMRAMPKPGVGPADCDCDDGDVPRTPDQWDLANSPGTFSTDLGLGCVRFNVPNRAIEEFDFYTVVRTTEPEIRGITVDAASIKKRRDARIALETIESWRASELDGPDESGPEARVKLIPLLYQVGSPRAVNLIDLMYWWVDGTAHISDSVLGEMLDAIRLEEMSGQLDEAGRPPGRSVLDHKRSVDWDDTPTFYEAATIAHGHLLHFKQTWYADGYSLGDLLYSLPLGPGQKRLIAVVDWERREQAGRSEDTSVSESLSALLSRDRDLNDVVSGALGESMGGGSQASTFGIGGGTGGAGSGSYGAFSFGALAGVSGGYGQGNADAWQNSARNMSASSLQTIRDTTLQSASAVRGLRSTTVYTATQGEAVRASTEVVANHNHCHALTIQYFEVLRHLKLMVDLADVQECLFVPLPMEGFDGPKVRRWRESLAPYLRRPELTGGFDASRRVETNWLDVDYPASRYADENVVSIAGELQVTLLVPLPPFPEVPKPNPGQTTTNVIAGMGEALNPTKGALGVIFAVFSGGLSLAVGQAQSVAAQGASALAESLAAEPSAKERYDRFQHEVMPPAAVGFVDQLELWALVGNNEVKQSGIDFTLVSDYQPGAPMLVSVRGRLNNQTKRADISQLTVKSDRGLPPGCRVILNSATLRYRTAGFEHAFVTDGRVNDDIELPTISVTFPAPGQITITKQNTGRGATLYTPIDTWEQRNPRKDDQRLASELVDHLNDNLEYYHHAIWWTMDPDRRYMLLDGYLAPGSGNRSVASVVENRLIGLTGNSMVLPVARGVHLDPRFASKKPGVAIDLLKHYAPDLPTPPARVSLPTRGVFAEAVMGSCNACEQVDDTRFWRWQDAPLDDVPAIDPPSTSTRGVDLGANTTPSTLPSPIVSIQNAAAAPDPAGLAAAAQLLDKSTFNDLTGLAASQAGASAAYTTAVETALAYGKEASKLAQQAAMLKGMDKSMDSIDKLETEGKIPKADAQRLRVAALEKAVGGTGPSLGTADVEERLKTINDATTAGQIDSAAARELSRSVLDGYTGADGSDSGDAAARLMQGLDPGIVADIETSDGEGNNAIVRTGWSAPGGGGTGGSGAASSSTAPRNPRRLLTGSAAVVQIVRLLESAQVMTVPSSLGPVTLRPGTIWSGDRMLVSADWTTTYYSQGDALYEWATPAFIRDEYLNALSEGASRAEGMVVLAKIEIAFMTGLLAPWWAVFAVSAASLGLAIHHYRDEVETGLDKAPRVMEQILWLRENQPELYENLLKSAYSEIWSNIPNAFDAQDAAFWLGRVLGLQKGVAGVAGAGAAVTLGALLKIIVRVTAIVAATHVPDMIGAGLQAAARKHGEDLQARLKAEGIDVTKADAEKILRELYADPETPARLRELEESLERLQPALKRLGESLHR